MREGGEFAVELCHVQHCSTSIYNIDNYSVQYPVHEVSGLFPLPYAGSFLFSAHPPFF